MKQKKIRNWSEYNNSLISRGSLNFWIDENALNDWYCPGTDFSNNGDLVYTDLAIKTCLQIKYLFDLSLRSVEGFINSVFSIMGLKLKSPSYSTICRRQEDIKVPEYSEGKDKFGQLVIDSTGLKVFGEGEWKVRNHGYSKRRTWRKLHLVLEVETRNIIATRLTENSCHDSQVFKDCFSGVKKCKSISADRGYDTFNCYKQASGLTKKINIDLRKSAKIKYHGNSKIKKRPRDENLRKIRKSGRKKWKKESKYHVRSVIESIMFRFKAIFRDRLSARILKKQTVEVNIKTEILNKMNLLGIPRY